MNDDYELYDARVGVQTYAQYIRESLEKKESWRDIVRGAAELCIEIQDKPACTENPYLCNLLITVVVGVLLGPEDYFGESDKARELALVRRTKKEIMNSISWIEEMVDDSYPETAD